MAGILADKVIIITGGSTGIGHATALRCAEEGASLVIADVNKVKGQELADQLTKSHRRTLFVATDVSKADQVQAMVATTVKEFGRLDAAFNNAGIEGVFSNTVKITEDEFERTLAINLKGVWLSMKYEIEQMLNQEGAGAVVNTASVAGLIGTRGGAAYCASKHGVVGLTKCAALDYARKKIRVNAVCPGVVQTEMLDRIMGSKGLSPESFRVQEPMERFGVPREIADAVVWLLSDQASFVTGIAMPIDGGYTAV